MDKIKINLGCGDKPLEGYINVDIAESRLGVKPDVLDDVRYLMSFKENFADEILSVHLIEHIDRWEIENVTKRWAEILKDDGRLVIETPNLLSACKALIANPVKGARADKNGQMTMWPFYGDPSWKDPLMMHKWLYTPQSLAEILYSTGFKKVVQDVPKFKMGAPRDMRIIAYKI
jgi:SAM-dependent methyltransferase